MERRVNEPTMARKIFEYENYREYLRDHLGISLRAFGRKAGITSAGYLQYVLNGKRNLTMKTIPKFAQALRLNREEADFFENLVHFNQAKNSEDKNVYWERMLRSRMYRQTHAVEQKQYKFYSNWYCTAIRELVNSPDFKDDPAWIAQMLEPPISAKEAEKALAVLIELGLIKKESNGHWEQADPSITTGDQVRSLAIVNFHKEMIQLGKDSIERIPSVERDISALTIGVPEGKYAAMADMVRDFRKQLVKKFGGEKSVQRIYQLNIQLFPLNRNASRRSS